MLEPRRLQEANRKEPTGRTGVEFVCTGNICRSPFAAAVAITLGVPSAEVYSSGLWADPGRRCPPAAIEAAAELGVDLTDHQAHVTERDGVRQRAWVLLMEYDQLRQVEDLLSRDWGGRVGLLGEFCAGAGVEIPDPYGESVQKYRVIYGLIREAVGNWITAVQGGA